MSLELRLAYNDIDAVRGLFSEYVTMLGVNLDFQNYDEEFAGLRTYVTEFRDFIDRTSLVVGITHADQGGWQTRQLVSRELVAMGLPPTAMDTDARSRAHMATLVKALIYGIDPFNNAQE